MLPSTCKNCLQDNPLQARYCNTCGQTLHQHRIDSHYLWHELQHGLLHVDKGIFYTTKELLRRPGRMVREFLDGKRTAHFKPVGFLIASVTASVLVRQFVLGPDAPLSIAVKGAPSTVATFIRTAIRWLEYHPAFLALLFVLPLAAALYWAFRKPTGVNYFESLVLVLYMMGLAAVVRLLFVPVQLLLPGQPLVVPLRMVATIGYMGLGFFQFYEAALPSPWRRLGRLLWALLLAMLITFGVILVFTGTIAIVLKILKYAPR